MRRRTSLHVRKVHTRLSVSPIRYVRYEYGGQARSSGDVSSDSRTLEAPV